MAIGGILTAMVTPFGADGAIDEDAFVSLARHLLDEGGSDGLVVAGTTGEGSTLSDDEKCRLWELAVAESGDAPVIAGTGSNDTKHSAELTERASGLGVDAVLAVTPYYNRPNRRGILAHFQAVAAATELPVVLYNIPQRCAIDMPNDLLRELAEIDNVVAVKQARYEELEPIEGLTTLAGNDDMLPEVLDMGGGGGILVASHLAGPRDAADDRRARQPARDPRVPEAALPGADRGAPRPPRSRARSACSDGTSASRGFPTSRSARTRRPRCVRRSSAKGC